MRFHGLTPTNMIREGLEIYEGLIENYQTLHAVVPPGQGAHGRY